MFDRKRAATILATALLAAAGATAAFSSPALAKACPATTTKTVSASPSYTYTRGCIHSFDGTAIIYNLFEPLHPKRHSLYTILEGPGWGSAGDTTPDEHLISAGYAEMTWDPRGFGESSGVVQIDSPKYEGRDVQELITKVLTGRRELAVDTLGKRGQPRYTNDSRRHNTKGEPVIGMTSASYGGGIQWSTASFDRRIKAIVPEWSWNDLDYSLAPGGVIKLGWDELLFGAGAGESAETHLPSDVQGVSLSGVQAGNYPPQLYTAQEQATANGYFSSSTLGWLHERSYAAYGAGRAGHAPEVPTLAIQGSVDTLFNLNDGWANLVESRSHYRRIPLKMIAYCGGHVSCPTGSPPGGVNYSDTASKSSPLAPGMTAGDYLEDATIAWFNHYLRGTKRSLKALHKLIPASDNLVYQAQNGNFYPLSTFPTPTAPGPATYHSAPVSGTVVSQSSPGGVSVAGEDLAVTDGPTASGSPAQVTVPVLTASKRAIPIVGIPRLTAKVTVTGGATNLFFRLLDKQTGHVIDLQTGTQRLTTSAAVGSWTEKIALNLPGVTYLLAKGDTLELQVSTSTESFVPNRVPATVKISGGRVSVPTLGVAHRRSGVAHQRKHHRA